MIEIISPARTLEAHPYKLYKTKPCVPVIIPSGLLDRFPPTHPHASALFVDFMLAEGMENHKPLPGRSVHFTKTKVLRRIRSKETAGRLVRKMG